MADILKFMTCLKTSYGSKHKNKRLRVFVVAMRCVCVDESNTEFLCRSEDNRECHFLLFNLLIQGLSWPLLPTLGYLVLTQVLPDGPDSTSRLPNNLCAAAPSLSEPAD